MPSFPTEDIHAPSINNDATFSRRSLGKRLLLGASALAVMLSAGKRDTAQAAPLTDLWKLGGNTGVNTDGTNFIGTLNVAPLVFKTAATANVPTERMRITPSGSVGIGTTTPSARLDVTGTTRVTGAGNPTSGSGIEMQYSSGTGYLLAYDRSAAAYKPLSLRGSTLKLYGGAGTGLDVAANGTVGIGTATPAAWLHSRVNSTLPAIIGETFTTLANANGVIGRISSTTPGVGSAAVLGENKGTSSNGVGVRGTHAGEGYGVLGENGGLSTYSAAVRGIQTGGGSGVYGTGSAGVRGEGSDYGILGSASAGTGVKGICFAPGSSINGVFGEVYGQDNIGVRGEANYGGQAKGVWGLSSSGWAGYFSGNALVTGTLVKGGGSFKIDHPLDPENKYLSHSFVESPDMKNVYDGVVTLDGQGQAIIELPVYFGALNRDFRYQLTTIGGYAPVYIAEEINDNRFTIAGGKPGMKVSWQVTGIRQDAFANANRIPIEETKPKEQRGKYLHPKEYGKPESAGIDAEHILKGRDQNPQRWSQDQQPVSPSEQ